MYRLMCGLHTLILGDISCARTQSESEITMCFPCSGGKTSSSCSISKKTAIFDAYRPVHFEEDCAPSARSQNLPNNTHSRAPRFQKRSDSAHVHFVMWRRAHSNQS